MFFNTLHARKWKTLGFTANGSVKFQFQSAQSHYSDWLRSGNAGFEPLQIQRVRTDSGAHPVSYEMGTDDSFSGSEDDVHPVVKVKNTWICTSISPWRCTCARRQLHLSYVSQYKLRVIFCTGAKLSGTDNERSVSAVATKNTERWRPKCSASNLNASG